VASSVATKSRLDDLFDLWHSTPRLISLEDLENEVRDLEEHDEEEDDDEVPQAPERDDIKDDDKDDDDDDDDRAREAIIAGILAASIWVFIRLSK